MEFKKPKAKLKQNETIVGRRRRVLADRLYIAPKTTKKARRSKNGKNKR